MPTRVKKYKAETVRLAFRRFAVGEESGDGEQRMFCPICENSDQSKTPSASINAEEGVWNCLKGNHGGKIWDLVQDLKTTFGFDIRAESMKSRHADPKYKEQTVNRLANTTSKTASGTPLPSQDTLDKWSSALISNKTALRTLMEQRGFEQSTIMEWSLGWDGTRYTIPVFDSFGELVNVRRYKLNAGTSDKMLNLPGHGTAQIFGMKILKKNEDIVITEGETDCILLNQYGIPAVTHTAGASTFRAQWGNLFQGKNVWICYDADDAGRKGAKKVEAVVSPFAAAVYIMEIPASVKGADVTDYLHKEGHSARDFNELMGAAMDRAGVAKISSPVAQAGKHTNLNDSMSQDNQASTLELVVSIAGKQQEPYTAPKRLTVTCDQSKGAACQMCPIAGKNGQAEFEIRIDEADLFRFVDTPEAKRKSLMKEISGARCTDRADFDVEENYHIEELLVQPSVDDRKDGETQQPVRRTVFSVGSHSSSVNSKVRMVGKNVADPRTGRLRFMSWVNEQVDMDIDNFKLDESMRQRLAAFQPSKGQRPIDKCMEIAADMSANVTHIYGRDLLHVGYDLVWHSVIGFNVFDMRIEKGWLEMGVIGDTRTGKSEIAVRLSSHYRSGKIFSCEGASFPGIVGGVQQIDGRWHMTWGVVPMNDRRLVVLDEVSGLKEKDVIEQMSSIRSSGVAQITKIQSEETSARTRLVWVMNPGDGSMLKDSPTGGMGAIRTVVHNAEDIARFDFVMATSNTDVDPKTINYGFTSDHEPSYSTEDSEALVKWVWSLTHDDVVISQAAADAAVKAAMDLGSRYMADPPLVQAENVRFKVLRVAAAIAARTFSVTKEGRLIVREAHVEDAVTFLDAIYSQPAMGYGRASRKRIQSQERARQKRTNVLAFLREHETDVLLTLRMVGGNTFRGRDLEEFGGMSKDAAKEVVNQLLTWQVVRLKSRGEVGMEPVLLEVIREIDDGDDDPMEEPPAPSSGNSEKTVRLGGAPR